jgi:hypothetical protein
MLCNVEGCSNLQELILADDGPRLTFPPGFLERLTALRVLDLGRVRAPVLDRRRLLKAMPSLTRLTVPRGALPVGLVSRLRSRSRGGGCMPCLKALFGAGRPAGGDVIVVETGGPPNAAALGAAAPAAVLPVAAPPCPSPPLPLLVALQLALAALFVCVQLIPA